MKSVCFIPLTQGHWAVVDLVDAARVSELSWHWDVRGYAFNTLPRNKKPKLNQSLHQFVFGKYSGFEIDHINGEGLDCRRSNLRLATGKQNQQNKKKCSTPSTSRFKGVSWHKQRQKWRACIFYDGKQRHLGLFDVESDAAWVYDTYAIQIFGAYAKTNFSGRN